MITKEFAVHKENDTVIELREVTPLLLLKAAIVFATGFVLYLSARNSIARLFGDAVFLFFIILGLISLFYQKTIVLDKRKNVLKVRKGLRNYVVKEKAIEFGQIKHIVIAEKVEAKASRQTRENLYLYLNDGSKVKIGYSERSEYTNDFTFKLSSVIGCEVIKR